MNHNSQSCERTFHLHHDIKRIKRKGGRYRLSGYPSPCQTLPEVTWANNPMPRVTAKS